MDILCDDTVTGDYSGTTLELAAIAPFDGELTLNASGCEFEIQQIVAFHVDNPSNWSAVVSDGNVSLTLHDVVESETYIFQVTGAVFGGPGISEGTFHLALQCMTHAPTTEPTWNPTVDPTDHPSWSPTEEPSSGPTHDPTMSPTSRPSSDPTYIPSAVPTGAPSVEPTYEPTPGHFLLVEELLNFTEAQDYCQLHFGTSLASIHSEEERDEAEELCQARQRGTGCWIGLYRVLKGEAGKPWYWTDATPLDYGFVEGVATAGEDPWWPSSNEYVICFLFSWQSRGRSADWR